MGGNGNVFWEDDADIQVDPWELPPYFLLRHKKSDSKKQKNLRTPSGYWKEKEAEFIGIRSRHESSSSGSPSYDAVRKTFEFYLKDGTRGGEGTKTDWIFHEYQDLRKDDGSALFLEDDEVIRKVFKKGETDESRYSRLHDSLSERLWLDAQIARARRQIKNSIMRAWVARRSVTSEGLREDLGAQCHPDGKSDNVWKHFTKIRTDDPDVVYAVCHHCDKVLKAHSKKHGISHLQRHRNSVKCRTSCGNPSTDEDREMLRLLRAELHHPNDYEHQNQNMDQKRHVQEDLAHLDPWDLKLTTGAPLCYVTSSLKRQTPGGIWKEVEREFTAIRKDQFEMHGCWNDIDKDIAAIQMDQLQMQVPQYIGLRRTLQFHLQNGNKMDWIMFEYQQLDDNQSPALFLRAGMVIHKVFHHDKDAVATAFSDMDRWLNSDDDNDAYYNGDGVNTDTTMSIDYVNGDGDKKRKRTCASSRKSEVWMHFTEIHSTDRGVVYAVCHYCDRGYNGDSRNGTSHLKRHKKKCSSKHPVTGNVNDVNTAWEAEIWQLFRLLKNYGGCENIRVQGCAEARSQEHQGCSQ